MNNDEIELFLEHPHGNTRFEYQIRIDDPRLIEDTNNTVYISNRYEGKNDKLSKMANSPFLIQCVDNKFKNKVMKHYYTRDDQDYEFLLLKNSLLYDYLDEHIQSNDDLLHYFFINECSNLKNNIISYDSIPFHTLIRMNVDEDEHSYNYYNINIYYRFHLALRIKLTQKQFNRLKLTNANDIIQQYCLSEFTNDYESLRKIRRKYMFEIWFGETL